eukprot:11446358-Prorocentrum_lima.AAC.1
MSSSSFVALAGVTPFAPPPVRSQRPVPIMPLRISDVDDGPFVHQPRILNNAPGFNPILDTV